MANKYLKRCPSDWQKLEGQQYLLLEEKRVLLNIAVGKWDSAFLRNNLTSY